MAKIKYTKGELKKQRDALKAYERYLPTLALKKQQLQMEMLKQHLLLDEKNRDERAQLNDIVAWAGLLADAEVDIAQWVVPSKIVSGLRNIAGVDLPIFEKAIFPDAEYDLFLTPLWVDSSIKAMRGLVSIREEISLINEGIAILRSELRITTQRVNLFEKVLIPEAQDAIRRIKIYIGDQMANAVGRSKIAKRKIEEAEEAAV